MMAGTTKAISWQSCSYSMSVTLIPSPCCSLTEGQYGELVVVVASLSLQAACVAHVRD